MQNFSIIEDLAFDYCQKINLKNHAKALQDCFKRNLTLIRKYSDPKIKINRKVLQKNPFISYIEKLNSNILLPKQRFSLQITPKNEFLKKNEEEVNQNNFLTFKQVEPMTQNQCDVKAENQQSPQTQPFTDSNQPSKKLLNPKILSLLKNFDIHQNKEIRILQKEKNIGSLKRKPFSKINIIQKQQLSKKNQPQIQALSKICTSHYNDSINFHKKNFFTEKIKSQNTFHRNNNQNRQNNNNFPYLRTSYEEEKNRSKKIFALMGNRKSTKILKAKLFFELQQKNLSLSKQQKQKFTRNRNPNRQSSSTLHQSQETSDLKFKGKDFVPFISRSSLNLNDQIIKAKDEKNKFQKFEFTEKKESLKKNENILAALKQRISFLDQEQKQNPHMVSKMFETGHRFLISSNKKFRFSHFSKA